MDRISELPDVLLHQILSLLPIDQTVTTSILSTKWRYLWTSIPILNFKYKYWHFNSSNPMDVMKFMNFVDKFLLPRDTNIQKFSLEFNYNNLEESRANAWITNVMSHKVQELNLNVNIWYPFVFNPNLITCESLMKLTLTLRNCVLKFPMSTCFPRLKILRFEFFKFHDGYFAQHFSSNFPVLEELIMHYCCVENLNNFYISGPLLKRLDIKDFYGGEGGLSGCLVKINAPNLLYLSYISDYLPKDYILCNFPSLTEANIALTTRSLEGRSFEELGYCASKFLRSLSNVRTLRLWGKTFEMLSYAKDLSKNLPTFNNLIHLEVFTSFYFPSTTLLDLLHISPNLEYFAVDGDLVIKEDCWINEKVPVASQES